MAEDPAKLNKDTLALVQEFREEYSGEKVITMMDTTDVEIVIGRMRLQKLDEKSWRDFSDRDESDKTFRWRLMAYADDPKEVKQIAAHMKHENRSPTKTSLVSIVEPLISLEKRTKNFDLRNFLRNLSEIDDDNILRADRMFYGYMRQLLGPHPSYTLNHAHEQLQAIRILRFETDDTSVLEILGKNHKDFDTAYDYLRSCKHRNEQDARHRTSKSIVRESSREEQDKGSRGRYGNNQSVLDD